jgi:hypothetical protein
MTISLDAIALPAGLEWIDEHDWSPVTQVVKKTLTGALVISEQAQLKGRNITLQGDPETTWVTKTDLDQLLTKANTADLAMVLDYHGTSYNVMFLRDQTAIEARLIVPFSNPQSGDYYSLTLRLMEV